MMAKPWNPPSGKQNPPKAGAHESADTHRIRGDQAGGQQQPGVHDSLRKGKR